MATSTSQTAILTMEKSFTYRGAREHWQNAYHLDQVPASQADWSALATNVWTFESQFLPLDVQWEIAYGHEPGTPPVLVFEHDAAPTGEGGPGGAYTPAATSHPAPGDAAMWVRWGTTQKSSRGKPIYLRNYYHGVHIGAAADDVDVNQLNSLNQFGAEFTDGIVGATQTFRRAGPKGAVAQNHQAGPFVTTRTLKHRGRRHSFDRNSNPAGYSWKLIPSELAIN